MLKRLYGLFTAHPASVGETYGQHFFVALFYGLWLLSAGLAACFHAFFPFLFERTASNFVRNICAHMNKRTQEKDAPAQGWANSPQDRPNSPHTRPPPPSLLPPSGEM